ncbi:MAG: LysM peptidoglycan-binding domain-containing protein [Candidatus Tenebribacter burtonii]|jgi:membrane-bound lytic murein transglycosylase D|nr:LysM peptidoglycan-binding domain-containing protein [Candidatus Tenebribacter burtonii]
MVKILTLFSLLAVIFGCAITTNMEPVKPIENLPVVFSQVITDLLQQEIIDRNILIDSLYILIEESYFTIDSLYQTLEVANSRVAVNQDFIIPDSIVFAGRTFDLTNERIFDNFETIYKQELMVAHKFIPRCGKYFAYFDSIFSSYNVPLDTKYLAIAESRLSPMAGSRLGALGIWQFMPNTAKGYGMRIDSFIDERRNIFMATPAAAKYLLNARSYLKERGTDDWLLAMSSYNAGVGSIAKVIRQQEVYDFFDLLMRVDETHKYVWRAVAIKMIVENEEVIFGNKFDKKDPILENEHLINLTLKGHYKIDEWAKAQGTSIGKILEMNPWIKIYKRSRVKYSAVNDVVLPPGKYSVLIPKENVVDKKLLAKIEKQFLNKNAGFFTHHFVKRGDNLYDIARKYKTTVSRIKSLNHLSSNIIQPGQKLKLYGTSSGGSVKSSNNYHTVKKGDTVGTIAQKLGVSQKILVTRNNLKTRNGIIMIYPGQKLYY